MHIAKALSLTVMLMASALVQGCIAPGAVRLINKPTLADPLPPNNTRIALVVRDERPSAVQKVNMCGVNYQTAFVIPTAPLFLAHLEHLDQIAAYHTAKKLEQAGFQVVSSVPAVKTLSDQKVSTGDVNAADRAAAWKERQGQDLSAEEKKMAKKSKEGADLEDLNEPAVGPWGEALDVSNADYVIELKIKKFWTSYTYYGSISWMSANLALCSAKDPQRTVLFGKKIAGFGYFMSFFTPLTPSSDATVSFNMAYWQVMGQIESQFRSGTIRQSIDKGTISKP